MKIDSCPATTTEVITAETQEVILANQIEDHFVIYANTQHDEEENKYQIQALFYLKAESKDDIVVKRIIPEGAGETIQYQISATKPAETTKFWHTSFTKDKNDLVDVVEITVQETSGGNDNGKRGAKSKSQPVFHS